MSPRRPRASSTTVAAVLLAGSVAGATLPPPLPARADRPTVSVDQLRTQWDPNEPALTPAAVQAGFGRLFHVALDGVAYASPVTAHGVIVVATEHDRVYGIDETSGAVRWQVGVGTYGDDHGCNQVTPSTDVGVTSTPVIDSGSNTVYVMARDWHGNSPATAWRLHALDLFSGNERANWTIGGTAANTNVTFDAYQHEQRPGLLLLGSTVVAGFGSYCDSDPYQGWIATVNTASGAQSLYDDVPGATEGAFWESGSGFVNDGPGTFLATSSNPPTGSGTGQAPVGPGTQASSSISLADSVIRFRLGSDGVTVTPVDYFSPARQDTTDADLGSSGFAALPDALGVSGHPHLGVVGGKFGTLYVLDRDHLGGRGASSDSGALSSLTGTDNLFGQVASWPGDGGYVYDAGSSHLNAFRLSSTGTLTRVASASIGYGSGSPLVTSNGTTPGSATAWIYEHGSRQLQAYAAVPSGSSLTQLYHYPVGSSGDAHFNQVSADAGRIMVATDGSLDVFGTPNLPPVPCACGGADGHNPTAAQGYWEVAADGGIFPWGNAAGYGSTGAIRLNAPIVAMLPTPSRHGYLLVAADGGVFPFGDAQGWGSLGSRRLNAPIVGGAVSPQGGYWLVGADGGVFPFGPGAAGYGSTGGVHLNQPVVGMAATSDGGGYWLVAADGGIFPFGDAQGWGSTGAMRLNRPVVGMAAATGGGYWLVASDGGIFPFGPGAGGYGSTGALRLNQPVVGMAATLGGRGYWLVAGDGGIFPFGDAQGYGSTGNVVLNRPVVGIAAS